MKKLPNPAMVVALVALFFSLVGGGYAAGKWATAAQLAATNARLAALNTYMLCQDGVTQDEVAVTWYALHSESAWLKRAITPSWPDYSVPAGTTGLSTFDDKGSCAKLGIKRPAFIIVPSP